MSETDDQRLTIDLETKGGRFEISSPEELRRWAEDERERWRWMGSFSQGLAEQYQRMYSRMDGLATDWQNKLNAQTSPATVFSGVYEIIREFYLEGRIFHCSSDEGRFIQDTREKHNNDAGAGAYFTLSEMGWDRPSEVNVSMTEGVFRAMFFKLDIKASAESQRTAFAKLAVSARRQDALQKKRFKELEDTNTQLNQDFSKTLGEQKTAFDNQIADQKKEFSESVEDGKSAINAVRKSYEIEMALRAPVQYWEDVSREHGQAASEYITRLCVLALVLMVAMVGVVSWLFSGQKDPSHARIGVAIVAGVLAIWFLRLVQRLYLSHLHLKTDADEKTTLLMTYLALVKEGKEFDPEDKTLILQHLFRGTSDGLVHDEASAGTVDTLAKILAGNARPHH